MCARRAPGKLLIVRLETSISGQPLSLAHRARRLHIWGRCGALPARMVTIGFARATRLQEASRWNGTRKRTLSSTCSRKAYAFVHDLAERRKRLMLDRSLQIEFESYRKTPSSADRLAFDESIERLVSKHGIDYVRGYVDALKERGSQ